MKKRFFILGLLILFAISKSSAQEGMKFGINFGFLSSNPVYSSGSKIIDSKGGGGYKIALSSNYGIAENYGFHTGLHFLFHNFGTSVNKAFVTGEENVLGAYRLTSLEVPLGLKLRTNDLTESGIYGHALLLATADFNIGARTTYLDEGAEKAMGHFRVLGAGIRAGAGVEKELDFGTFMLSACYKVALTNALKQSYTYEIGGTTYQPNQDKSAKLNYFSIELGYRF